VSGTDAVTYMVWDGQRWLSPPVSIMGHLEYPNIAISRGHVLHVVAMDFQRIFYIPGTTAAPELLPRVAPLPTPVIAATQDIGDSVAQATASVSPTTAVLEPGTNTLATEANSLSPVLVGVAMAFLLVGAVAAATLRRGRA